MKNQTRNTVTLLGLLFYSLIQFSCSKSATQQEEAAAQASAQLKARKNTHPGVIAAAGNIVVVPDSIDASGKVDVTLSLQNFLNKVKDNSQIQFKQNGQYRLDGTILLSQRTGLQLYGNGAKFFAVTDGSSAIQSNLPTEIKWLWPRKRSQFAVRGGSGHRFYNMEIQGANFISWTEEGSYNSKLEAQHGFDIEGATDIEIKDCHIHNVYGDFVYVGIWNAGTMAWANGVKITNNNLHDNGRQGIAMVGASNVLIEGNTIKNTRRSTFDIEPDNEGSGASNIAIRNNTVGEGRLLFLASGGQQGSINNVEVSGNYLVGRPLSIGVYTRIQGSRKNWVITNNKSEGYAFGSPIALMTFEGVDNVEVTGNIHEFQVGQPTDAVKLIAVRGYKVEGNTFKGNRNDLVLEATTQKEFMP